MVELFLQFPLLCLKILNVSSCPEEEHDGITKDQYKERRGTYNKIVFQISFCTYQSKFRSLCRFLG